MNKHSCFRQSQLAEGGFGICRNVETLSLSAIAPVKTLCNTLVSSQILATRHRFEEVGGVAAELGAAMRSTSRDAFVPLVQLKECDPPCTKIISVNDRTPWFKRSLDDAGRVFVDALLLRAVDDVEQRRRDSVWESFQNRWATCLLRGRVLVRRKDVPLQARAPLGWYFALAGKFDSVVPLYPARESRLVGEASALYFLPDKLQEPVYAAILNFNAWEATPYEWRSPLVTWFEHPNARAHDENFKFVAAFPTTEPDSILRVAARSGSWDIGVGALRKFQAELFIDAGDADDTRKLFPVLMSLVTGILQCSADEALAIISARLGQMGLRVGTDELLNVDEGLELVERHEREVIKQEKSTLLNEADDVDQLLANLVKFQKTRAGARRASHVVQQPLPDEIRQ
jgi:hypothetical protein